MHQADRQSQPSGVSSIVDPVCRLPQVRRIERAIRDGRRRIDVAGLRGTSLVLVAEALRRALGRTLVVCCRDGEAAEDAASDFRTISAGRVHVFPEKDIFPQPFELRENLTIRGRRSACLDRVLRGEVDIIVTSLSGLREKTIPADRLAAQIRDIHVGDRIELESLLEHLVNVGYDGGQVVEEIGQFAVRGAIVDVFDPSWDLPVRLELVDDEITSMRTFDIDSQRSVEHVGHVRILPATGALVNDQTLDTLAGKLRDEGFARQTIKSVREEIEHHRFSYLVRRYAPAMGMEGNLLDFFDVPPVVIFWDEAGMADAVQRLESDYEKIARVTSDEFPLLGLEHYVHPADFYTAYDIPALHVWSLSGAGVAVAEGVSREGTAVGGEAPAAKPAPRAPEDIITFETQEHPSILGKVDALSTLIHRLDRKGMEILIFSESTTQRERLADMLEEDESLVHLPVGWVTAGFIWPEAEMAVLTDHQIFHRAPPRPSDKRKTRRAQGQPQDHLQPGDFVVHVDYGIGRYTGLEKVKVGQGETECLSLRYLRNDRIFVPVDQMLLVEKYVGKEGVVPSLDRLGSGKWQRTKARTKKALEEVARDMLRAYAAREIAEREPFRTDTQWQRELEASFPFEETPHQLRAAEEIKNDMQSPKPMDRLVCGDVGFGKTEVAIRAAFKAVNDGKQVGVIVPTTILALQHLKTFSERVALFPVRVEMLSRFKSAAEQKKIVEDIRAGLIDIVIGTHRLLSKDVEFNDIGLLIVDEEHRFGVRSKEKIKRIKASVDVLSMTATPIPRTLYLALSGLRPISVIDTPPRNRHPIHTEVLPFDEDTIAQAIRSETAREGQVFFLHNRVASIHSIQAFLERLLPDVTFCVAHGQMPEKELERVIVAFVERKYDVLISTTIIESGLDFPNVNTIIINRADRFGLADLYQLRGRVGRRERQAFAYLLVPRNFAITQNAGRRLQAMEEFEELGSGYRLAMRDLEIRGAGNLLGVEQHGRLVAVGFDLYCKMLKEAVEEAQGQVKTEAPPCTVETQLESLLPDTYVEDQNERMAIYKRLARMEIPADVDHMEAELADRFGPPPPEAINLLSLTRLKLEAMAVGIALIQFKTGRTVVEFLPGKALPPRVCAAVVETFEGRVLFKSGSSFGLTLSHARGARVLDDAMKLLGVARERLNGGKLVDGIHSAESP